MIKIKVYGNVKGFKNGKPYDVVENGNKLTVKLPKDKRIDLTLEYLRKIDYEIERTDYAM